MGRATKYYIVLTSLTILLILSILFFNYRIYHHDLFHLKQQVAFSLNLVSGKVSQEMSSDILVISDTLADLAMMPSVNEADVKHSRRRLEESFNRLKEFHVGNIELLNSHGARTTSISVPGWKNPPISFQQYFQSLQDGNLVKPIYKIIPGLEKTSGKVLLILMPMFDADGELNGAVSAFLKINQLVGNYNALDSQELYLWLLERNGQILFYPGVAPLSVTGNGTTMDSSMVQFINKLNAGELLQGEYISPDGRNTLAVASVVDGFGKDLFLVFATPEENIKDLLRHFHADHLIATFCIVFLVIGGSLFVFIAIVRWNNVLHQEIVERKETEKQKEYLICELEQALCEIKVLSGFLPICASCKKIREDNGYWKQIEVYISEHSKAQFSHGICPDCRKELYPDFPDKG